MDKNRQNSCKTIKVDTATTSEAKAEPSQKNGRKTINDYLDIYSMVKIFNELPLEELLTTVSDVCQHWRSTAIKTVQGYRNLILMIGCDLKHTEYLLMNRLHELPENALNHLPLKSWNRFRLRTISSDTVDLLSDHFTSLTNLVIAIATPADQFDLLVPFLTRLSKKLRTLSIYRFPFIDMKTDERAVSTLYEALPQLTSLSELTLDGMPLRLPENPLAIHPLPIISQLSKFTMAIRSWQHKSCKPRYESEDELEMQMVMHEIYRHAAAEVNLQQFRALRWPIEYMAGD